MNLALGMANYSVEAHRMTNDTFFHVSITAYRMYWSMPPVPLELYVFWTLGILLILLGVFFTRQFIRLTKEYVWAGQEFQK
jgi:hypothetical protein